MWKNRKAWIWDSELPEMPTERSDGIVKGGVSESETARLGANDGVSGRPHLFANRKSAPCLLYHAVVHLRKKPGETKPF